jgi:hypothetical protein
MKDDASDHPGRDRHGVRRRGRVDLAHTPVAVRLAHTDTRDRRAAARDGVGASAPLLRVHFDGGIHRRPTVAMCQVIRRHGRDGAGVDRATVEHEGGELQVETSMVSGVWRPVRPIKGGS